MTHEINAEFYCGAFERPAKGCPDCGNCERLECEAYHRKWPTPEQFKAEYGKEYPDDAATYSKKISAVNDDWECISFYVAKAMIEVLGNTCVVCACSPFGIPPDDWRPKND